MGKKNEISTVKQGKNIFLGLVIFAILLFFVAVFIKYVGELVIRGFDYLSQLASKTDAVIIVALMTGTVSIFGVVISAVISRVIEYKQTTKRYLFEKREEPYSDFISMVYKIQTASKAGEKYEGMELLNDILGFSQKLTLWGSSRVIRKWLKFRLNSQDPNFDPTSNLFILEDIIFEIRKDMGHKKRGLSKGDMLKFFVNDIDDHLSKKVK